MDNKHETECEFEKIQPGHLFWHFDNEFVKTERHWRSRYGYVNAHSVTLVAYAGDTGHRYLHADQIVRKI